MFRFTFIAVIVAIFLVVSVVSAVPPRAKHLTTAYTYEMFVKDFNHQDRDAKEHVRRKALFDANLKEVLEHNNKQPRPSYTKGINKFADWTAEEKRGMMNNNYLAVKQASAATVMKPLRVHQVQQQDRSTRPFSVDWRSVRPSVVTAVKDQGQCGSCWAHAATEAIESAYAIATGQLIVLSQEQIVACTPNPDQCGGTGGCWGATLELAYDYVAKVSNGGLSEEWENPYTSYLGQNSRTCIQKTKNYAANIKGYVEIPSNDADALMDAIAQNPVAIMADASHWFQYEGGIFTGCSYSKNISMDHGIVIVGYGYDEGLDMNFYLTRNSWGSAWGEEGYIRLKRAKTPAEEKCGWNVDPGNGNGCKGQTKPQWACCECGLCFDTNYPIPAPLK